MLAHREHHANGSGTCQQGALGGALLHEDHVLQQGTVGPRAGLRHVGGQVGPGQEGGAQGQHRLKTATVLRRRGHLGGGGRG